MAILGIFLNVLGPVAVVIAVGYFSGPRLGIEAFQLSRLAYWVLGPAFMFEIMWDTELSGAVAVRLTVAAVVAMAVAAAVGAVAVKLLGGSKANWSAAAMTSCYGNVGNTGLAVSSFALGPSILPAAGVFMLAINVPGMILGITLAEAGRRRLWHSIARAILAPIPVASVLAFVVNIGDFTPPLVLTRSVGVVSAGLIPIMLYALGVQLAESGRVSLSASVTVPTMAKLVVAPVVAGLVAVAVGLDGDLLAVTVIQSAMPPAVFCMVVALEQGLAPRVVTSTVVVATLLATATVPFAILIVS